MIKQIENGEFTQNSYTLILESGVQLWTRNGVFSLGFHPDSGKSFSLREKIDIWKAIKKGRIKQAIGNK